MKALYPLLILLLLAGCGRREESGAKPLPPHGRPLSIGLLPEKNLFVQIDRYEPLAAYLTAKLGTTVQLRILPRYGDVIREFESKNLDAAFFGSFIYVLAREHLKVEVLARPQTAEGRSTYQAVLIARKSSGIGSFYQLKGKVFAFVDRATMAGYLFPMALLRQHHVGDYRRFFREAYFAGTHEDVARDVLEKRADAGSLKSTVYEALAATDPGYAREIVILARSKEVPENGLAVRGNLPPETKQRMRAALLGMHGDERGASALRSMGAARFIPTSDEDYFPVLQYVGQAGLELSTFDYLGR